MGLHFARQRECEHCALELGYFGDKNVNLAWLCVEV